MRANGAPNFKLTGQIELPDTLDYDIFGLHKKYTITKGELRKVEYFKNFDGQTYSDLIVEELRDYTRDNIRMAQFRTQTSRWFLEDNTVGLEKTFIKFYNVQTSIEEGITRRTNMITEAKIFLLTNPAVGPTNGEDLLNTYVLEINKFINGSEQLLRDAIANTTKPYMTQELKNATVEILNY